VKKTVSRSFAPDTDALQPGEVILLQNYNKPNDRGKVIMLEHSNVLVSSGHYSAAAAPVKSDTA
jgi:hypothetical protein